MNRVPRIVCLLAGLFLAIFTTGFTGPARNLSLLSQRHKSDYLSSVNRMFQKIAVLFYDHESLKGRQIQKVIDLTTWKRSHPWHTLHFAVSHNNETTIAVTSQVGGFRRGLRVSDHSKFATRNSSHVIVTHSQEPKEQRPLQAVDEGLKIASLAMTLLGKPYVWGGSDPSRGFDCSGLVEYVLREAGISSPRTSWQQFSLGHEVSINHLRPGDLLFFSTYAKGPSHVGIYVGNDRFVNALNPSTGVILSQVTDPYFAKRLIGIRNPLS